MSKDLILEAARSVWRLLVHEHDERPFGISREGLAEALNLNDRTCRDAVEVAALHCASLPEPAIVGFDPKTQMYVWAREPIQAKRVMEFYYAYAKSHLERLKAYLRACDELGWQAQKAPAIQEALFTAERGHVQGWW